MYPHSSFKGSSQDVIYWQLGIVAPHLSWTHPLGWRHEEAVLCRSTSAQRNILMVASKSRKF